MRKRASATSIASMTSVADDDDEELFGDTNSENADDCEMEKIQVKQKLFIRRILFKTFHKWPVSPISNACS
jgi:hypothetical protein